ncbi:hypothetical protein [Priestia megaterium]
MLNEHLIGQNVYIKFGKYHGEKGQIRRVTTKKGEPAFIITLDRNGFQVIKRQKNCILVGGSFDI